MDYHVEMIYVMIVLRKCVLSAGRGVGKVGIASGMRKLRDFGIIPRNIKNIKQFKGWDKREKRRLRDYWNKKEEEKNNKV